MSATPTVEELAARLAGVENYIRQSHAIARSRGDSVPELPPFLRVTPRKPGPAGV